MTEIDDDKLMVDGADDEPTEWTGTMDQFAKALEFAENIAQPAKFAFGAKYDEDTDSVHVIRQETEDDEDDQPLEIEETWVPRGDGSEVLVIDGKETIIRWPTKCTLLEADIPEDDIDEVFRAMREVAEQKLERGPVLLMLEVLHI